VAQEPAGRSGLSRGDGDGDSDRPPPPAHSRGSGFRGSVPGWLFGACERHPGRCGVWVGCLYFLLAILLFLVASMS
jgi:hypothetical protein